MPLPSYYDGEEEEENEERLLELLTVLVQMVRSKKPSTKLQQVDPMALLQKAKAMGIKVTPQLQQQAMQMIQAGKSLPEIMAALTPKQAATSATDELVKMAKAAGITITPAMQATAAKMLAQGKSVREIVEALKPKTKSAAAPESKTEEAAPMPAPMSSAGPRRRANVRQYNAGNRKLQTWSGQSVSVPLPKQQQAVPPRQANDDLKQAVLAKAKELGPPFQQQIEGAVAGGIPLQTIISQIPGGVSVGKAKSSGPVVDDDITKDEVYRKAFFLPPSKKKMVRRRAEKRHETLVGGVPDPRQLRRSVEALRAGLSDRRHGPERPPLLRALRSSRRPMGCGNRSTPALPSEGLFFSRGRWPCTRDPPRRV